jgi:peptidoglycan/xylan/chitin deacetylase (PgdA/CDA1 family)
MTMMALAACGNSFESALRNSVKDNKNAQSLSEWEASANHPEKLFADWNSRFVKEPQNKEQIQKDVCDGLTALSGQELSIFENEIISPVNAALLLKCKQILLTKIDNYFESERKTLKVKVDPKSDDGSGNNFKFPDNVQKRDTNNGYIAVNGDVGPKEVILTFDDGPSPTYTPVILKALKEVNAKAHFFELGKNIRANPDVTKAVAADGHVMGTHSVDHKCLAPNANCLKVNGRLLTFDEATDEIKGGHQAMYDTLGWVEPFFRFPYGETSPELKNFLKQNNTGAFFWNIDSEDWKAKSDLDIVDNTLQQLEKVGHGIILFHDIQRKTSEILPQFLNELYTRGYSVVILQPMDPTARFNSKLVTKHLP